MHRSGSVTERVKRTGLKRRREGAAGSSIESVSKLRCTIEPNEIMQKAGGGAQCNFETGQ